RADRHEVPHEGCTCGLYAAKELGPVLPLARMLLTSATGGVVSPTTAIVGKVQLAGKVIEHEHGYRAERARIAEILPIEERRGWSEAVGTRFHVPIGQEIPASRLPAPSHVIHVPSGTIVRFSRRSMAPSTR